MLTPLTLASIGLMSRARLTGVSGRLARTSQFRIFGRLSSREALKFVQEQEQICGASWSNVELGLAKNGLGDGSLRRLLEELADGHAEEELDVTAGLLELVEDQLHRFDRWHAGQGSSQDDDFIVFVGVIKQFLFPCA